jgi:hypothetical protein
MRRIGSIDDDIHRTPASSVAHLAQRATARPNMRVAARPNRTDDRFHDRRRRARALVPGRTPPAVGKRALRTRMITTGALLGVATAILLAFTSGVSSTSTADAAGPSILSWSSGGRYSFPTSHPFTLTSKNGVYSARWQTDGNWVVYHGSRPIWSTKTNKKGLLLNIGPTAGIWIVVKIPYSEWGNHPSSNGTGSYALDMQNDGNLVEYRNGTAVWSTNTVGK